MFAQIGRRRDGRQAPTRALTLSLVLLLGLMALMPLVTPVVGAEEQGNENQITELAPATSEEEQDALETELGEIDPATQIDEVLVDDVEVDPEPGTAEIYINKHGCPAGFDAYAASYYDLAANCHEDMSGIGFLVSDGQTVYGDQAVGAVAAGAVSFAQVPATLVSILEHVPDGYGTPIVYCNEQLMEVYGGNQISYLLSEDEYLYCDWFNVEEDYENTVTVSKWECPEVLAFVMEPTMEDYLAACTKAMDGVTFHLLTGGEDLPQQTNGGVATWHDVDLGPFSLVEEIPAGYGQPIVFCGMTAFYQGAVYDGFPQQVEAPGGVYEGEISVPNTQFFCHWFNVVDERDTSVTVYKWLCPEGFEGTDYQDYVDICIEVMDGVIFTLITEGDIALGQTTGDVIPGTVYWDGLNPGPISIFETLDEGYGNPVVFCGEEYVEHSEGGGLGFQTYREQVPAVDGLYSGEILDGAVYHLVCDWFNIPGGDGSITIYKWTCPVGYDLYAWGANPEIDCTEATDGVTFTLEQPMDVDLQSDTGDSIPGAVYFGGLGPGTYGVTETLPAGVAYGFVVGCSGLQVPVVLPYPLYHTDSGLPFYLELVGGEDIVCHWYNVPEHEDRDGKLTIIKYWCEGKLYNEHECALYSGGAKFALSPAEGLAPPYALETGVDGRASVEIKGAGKSYWLLKELNGKPCHVEVSKSEQGKIVVESGYETIVKVFNCGSDSTTTTTTKVKKFPNTGVGITASDNFNGVQSALVVALMLAGLGTVVALRRRVVGAWRFAKPSSLLLTGLAAVMLVTSASAQPPIVATEDSQPGTISVASDATAVATVEESEPDWRDRIDLRLPGKPWVVGERPVMIRIEAAQVNAEIEALDIIDGVMQDPTGATDVAWYKGTGRLGQPGNALLAGHLNWYGEPEAVFFALDTLQAGDEIELTGTSGETFRYRVEWVQLVDAANAPMEELLGPTDEESLTLITCGGAWDAAAGEYLQRTVVRATRIP